MEKVYEVETIDFSNNIHKRRYVIEAKDKSESHEKEAVERSREQFPLESVLDVNLFSCGECVNTRNKACMQCEMYCIHGYWLKTRQTVEKTVATKEVKKNYYKNKESDFNGKYKNYPTGFPYDMN